MSASLALITALALPPGASAILEGAVVTSFDGARLGARELFDFEAGGLRVITAEGTRVVVQSAGAAPACAAAGVQAPCLVPRLEEQAHARLLSLDEFRAGLQGDLALSIVVPPPAPPRPPWGWLVLSAFAAAFLGLLVWLDRARTSALGAVLVAARLARQAAGADPTLAVVRNEIDRMVAHAREVDALRGRCMVALDRVRSAPGRRVAAELDEEQRLQDDLARALARLHEIAAALRLVPLRVREAVRFAGPAPVEAILGELSLRERALSEASRL